MFQICVLFSVLSIIFSIHVDSFKGFKWYNSPKEYQLSEDSKILNVISHPISDYWQKTWYPGYSADTGNFFYDEFPSEEVKNLTMKVSFSGDYTELYDQSGLMIRLDENYWVKTGIEFEDSCPHASAVITNDFSDWSVVSLCNKTTNKQDFFHIQLYIDDKNAFEVSFSLDGEKYQLLRIGRLPFDKYKTVKLGIMNASPKNENGFKTVMKDFLLSTKDEQKCFVSEKGTPS